MTVEEEEEASTSVVPEQKMNNDKENKTGVDENNDVDNDDTSSSNAYVDVDLDTETNADDDDDVNVNVNVSNDEDADDVDEHQQHEEQPMVTSAAVSAATTVVPPISSFTDLPSAKKEIEVLRKKIHSLEMDQQLHVESSEQAIGQLTDKVKELYDINGKLQDDNHTYQQYNTDYEIKLQAMTEQILHLQGQEENVLTFKLMERISNQRNTIQMLEQRLQHTLSVNKKMEAKLNKLLVQERYQKWAEKNASSIKNTQTTMNSTTSDQQQHMFQMSSSSASSLNHNTATTNRNSIRSPHRSPSRNGIAVKNMMNNNGNTKSNHIHRNVSPKPIPYTKEDFMSIAPPPPPIPASLSPKASVGSNKSINLHHSYHLKRGGDNGGSNNSSNNFHNSSGSWGIFSVFGEGKENGDTNNNNTGGGGGGNQSDDEVSLPDDMDLNTLRRVAAQRIASMDSSDDFGFDEGELEDGDDDDDDEDESDDDDDDDDDESQTGLKRNVSEEQKLKKRRQQQQSSSSQHHGELFIKPSPVQRRSSTTSSSKSLSASGRTPWAQVKSIFVSAAAAATATTTTTTPSSDDNGDGNISSSTSAKPEWLELVLFGGFFGNWYICTCGPVRGL